RTPRRPDVSRLPLLGRTVSTRAIQQVADVETDPSVSPHLLSQARERGWRSVVQVPMLRDHDIVGVISVTRAEPRAFTPADIALLQTFADQAVIAVENVRLFKEVEQRNRDLTATSQILQVISRSPTDEQPVFEAIADSASR